MSLTASFELISATQAPGLANLRRLVSSTMEGREYNLNTVSLSDADLQDVLRAARDIGDSRVTRAIEAILQARNNRFDIPVPNFKAFQAMLEAFLASDLIDGWIYVAGPDGKLYPELVLSVHYDDGREYKGKASPTVKLITAAYTLSHRSNKSELAVTQNTHTFAPQDVTRKRITHALAGHGIYKETPSLKEAYEASFARHRERTMDGFAKQFRVHGPAFCYEGNNYSRRGVQIKNRRVIHDLSADGYQVLEHYHESCLFKGRKGEDSGRVPEHPLIRVFDLKGHEFYWVNADFMEPYAYDKSLREKLVLPKTHRDLLDVLTSDLSAFTGDIIEGKTAGNVILCKGIPGVGKTLTAEVYAELIERPLYAIHSGTLGTSAAQIERNLKQIFSLAKRWDCVLLLDEADVFVVQRGASIEQNAIVAEFLRALEYFDGLMFMTTNRPDDIDDAIISRCAAIIHYDAPGPEDSAAIWRVMASQHQVDLDESLVAGLASLFPGIAPRDIKMLFRLALRFASSRDSALDLDIFRRCAMFRAIKMSGDAPR